MFNLQNSTFQLQYDDEICIQKQIFPDINIYAEMNNSGQNSVSNEY
jgi:hypothetical protein